MSHSYSRVSRCVLLLCAWIPICVSGCSVAPRLTRGGAEPTELGAMVDEMKDADVVFLGELHDSGPGHRMQFEAVRALHAVRPKLVVSMEMFERDVQAALDDYCAGTISEQEFLAASRPWKNYREHYRPIVEFAKANGLRVVAANMPRKLARLVSQSGPAALDEAVAAGTAERSWIAQSTTAPEGRYWERFQGAMSGHGELPPADMRRFYQAQCYKDDTMAESIAAALDAAPGTLVVHLNGAFHSDFRLGTAARVLARRPEARVVTATMVRDDDGEAGRANFVWFVR